LLVAVAAVVAAMTALVGLAVAVVLVATKRFRTHQSLRALPCL
jgi:hypothetical protein